MKRLHYRKNMTSPAAHERAYAGDEKRTLLNAVAMCPVCRCPSVLDFAYLALPAAPGCLQDAGKLQESHVRAQEGGVELHVLHLYEVAQVTARNNVSQAMLLCS